MSRGKIGGDDMSTYASYTRQACNFVFPNISGTINGEKRPRPGMFKLSTKEGLVVDEGKNKSKIEKYKKSDPSVAEYIKATREYINATIEYFKDFHRKDKNNNHTIQDDVNNFYKKYDGSFTNMIESKDKKSSLFDALYNHSPKMLYIIFNILKSPGSALVYSNYVEMEGLQMFKIYLSFFGFTSVDMMNLDSSNSNVSHSKNGFRYMEFHGGIDKETRKKNKDIFNTKENKNGDIIKIIMISPAGTEGINLHNCRQVHILEPYWNEVRIEQVIGRAIRQCHHKDLPLEERTVDVFRYKMVRKSGKETSDEMMEKISRKKNNLLISFIEAIKEVSVDCELFKAHNMMGSKYNCFKFNEDTLFDKNIGPAYNIDIEVDSMMDNGLNSLDSIKKRIKVRKIKTVKKIDESNYSEVITVWFDEKTGIAYEEHMNYPLGRISKDEMGNYIKLDKDIYIMDKIINVPIFKLYN